MATAPSQPSPSTAPAADAAIAPGAHGVWALSGDWTLAGLGPLAQASGWPARPAPAPAAALTLDGAALLSIDTAGAWVLQRWLGTGTGTGMGTGTGTGASAGTKASQDAQAHPAPPAPVLQAWPPQAATLMQQVQADAGRALSAPPHHSLLQRVGLRAMAAGAQAQAFVRFVGEVALAGGAMLRQRRLWRLRTIWHEIEIGGFEALPIIGLTSFLLGVAVAYQGADQLRHYGANVFVVELVGYAMLREFAPLIGAIIIAGRSGSAYAAQIGTMVVAEEVDALRTIGIDPLQRLVLPKILALTVALPLLTVFADITGVFGGMVMARSRLDIGFAEFLARFGRVMQGSALLLGVGKSAVFAVIIASVGCFQGLRTHGSADSVGRQTTLSVVQSIFMVIVADALFSVAFNALKL